ncbi:MAG: hypothetical protein Q4D38_11110 [Planctomycetia bacterium]|nr:hypothetical protein [Planctomycetia bacterium]
MKKITIEICCGTTCYMLGASHFLNIEEELPEEWRERVEVRAIPCMDMCTSENICAAPFVKLNDKMISHVTKEILWEEIERALREGDSI